MSSTAESMSSRVVPPTGEKQRSRHQSAHELTTNFARAHKLTATGTLLAHQPRRPGSAPSIAKSSHIHESLSENSFLSQSTHRLQDTAVIPFDLIYSLCEVLHGITDDTLNQLAFRLGMRQDNFDHICQSTQRPIRFILIQGERNLTNLGQLQMIFHELGLFKAASLVSEHGTKCVQSVGGSHSVMDDQEVNQTNQNISVEFQTDDNSPSENEIPRRNDFNSFRNDSKSDSDDVSIQAGLVAVNGSCEVEKADKGISTDTVVKPDTDPKSTDGFTDASNHTENATARGATCRDLLNVVRWPTGSSVDSGIGSYDNSQHSATMSHTSDETAPPMAPWRALGSGSSDANQHTSEMAQPKSDISSLEEAQSQRHLFSSSTTGTGQSYYSLPYCGSGASLGSSERFSSLDLSFSGEPEADCPVVIQQSPQEIVDQERGVSQKPHHPYSRPGVPYSSASGYPQGARPSRESPGMQEPAVSHSGAGGLTVSGAVDGGGGILDITDSPIHLRIPPGALKKKVRLRISIILDPNQPGCPQSAECPRIMPLIRCEPDGLEFDQPVELVLPHCGIITEPEPKFEVYYRCAKGKFDTHSEWKRDDFASAKALVDCHGDRQTCHIMLKHFCDIDVFIRERGNIIGKLLRAFPLVSRLSRPGDDLLLSTWLCNNYNVLYDQIIREHAGVLVSSYQPYMLLESRKPLMVKFNSLNMQHMIDSDVERISYHHLWHGSQGYVTFRVKSGAADSEGTLLNGTLTVQQEDNDSIKFEIQRPVIDFLQPSEASFSGRFQFPPRTLPTQQSEPGESDKKQLTSPVSLNGSELYIAPNEKEGNHIHVHFPLPNPSSQSTLDHTIYAMSPPSFRVDYSLAVSLSMCLDGKDPLGNNWQLLAEKLAFKPLEIDTFGREDRKAKSILDTACKNGRLTSIEDLRTILKDMDRKDALHILDMYVEQNGVSTGKLSWPHRQGGDRAPKQLSQPAPMDGLGATSFGSLGNDPDFVDGDSSAGISQLDTLPVNLPHIPTPPLSSAENYNGACRRKEDGCPRYPLTGGRGQSPDELQDARQNSGTFSVDSASGGEPGLGLDEHERSTDGLPDQNQPVSSDEAQGVRGYFGSLSVDDPLAAVNGVTCRPNVDEQTYAENTTHAEPDRDCQLNRSLSMDHRDRLDLIDDCQGNCNGGQEDINAIDSPSPVEESESPFSAYMFRGGIGDGQLDGKEMSLESRQNDSSQIAIRIPVQHLGGLGDTSGASCHSPVKTPEGACVGGVAGSDCQGPNGCPDAGKMSEPWGGEEWSGESIGCTPSGEKTSMNGSVSQEVEGTVPHLLGSGDAETRSLPSPPIHSSTPKSCVPPSVQRELSSPTLKLSLGDGSSLSISRLKLAMSQIRSTDTQKADDSGFSSPVNLGKGRRGRGRHQMKVRMAPNFGNAESPPSIDKVGSPPLENGGVASKGYHAQSSYSSNDSGVGVARGGRKHTTSSEDEDLSGRFHSLQSTPSVNGNGVVTTPTSPPSEGDKGLHSQSSSDDSGIQDFLKAGQTIE